MTQVEKTVSRAGQARVVFQVVIGAVCLIALGAALFALVQVERNSKCETDPTGEACQQVKRKSDKARSIADTCAVFWKVGYACPKPGSRAAERQVQATAAPQPGTNSDDGGSSLAPSGATGAPEPVKGGAGGSPEPGHPGSGEPPPSSTGGGAVLSPAPTATDPSASPDGSTVGSSPPSVTPPSSPEPEADPPGLIQSTVDRVDEAITPTVCAAAELLRGTCP